MFFQKARTTMFISISGRIAIIDGFLVDLNRRAIIPKSKAKNVLSTQKWENQRNVI